MSSGCGGRLIFWQGSIRSSLLRFLLRGHARPRFLPRILDDFAVCFPECVPWEPQLGFTAQWNNPNALFRRPVFDQDPFGCRRRRRNLWMAAFYPWNLPPPLWPATTDSLKCKYTTPVYETDDTFLTRPLPRNQISFPFFGNCSSREWWIYLGWISWRGSLDRPSFHSREFSLLLSLYDINVVVTIKIRVVRNCITNISMRSWMIFRITTMKQELFWTKKFLLNDNFNNLWKLINSPNWSIPLITSSHNYSIA